MTATELLITTRYSRFFDDTAAQIFPAIESGDSIPRVAQHLHTPYETVRQAVNRLEDAPL